MSPACAGRSAGASSATANRSASSCWSTSSGGTSAPAYGTSIPFKSPTSTFGWMSTVAVKLNPLIGRLGQLVVVFRAGNGPNARADEGVPVPALDMALDRLRVEPLLADPGDEHLHRHFPLAEAGDLDGRGEVGGGVLDGVVDVVGGDVDGQADLVVRKLFDVGGHGRIVAMSVWAAVAVSAGGGTRTPKSRSSPGPKPGAVASFATPAALQG